MRTAGMFSYAWMSEPNWVKCSCWWSLSSEEAELRAANVDPTLSLGVSPS